MPLTLNRTFVRLMPWIFVWVWSTGFLVAKLGKSYAEPFTLLSYRFAFALAVLWVITKLFNSRWPSTWRLAAHCMVVGLLLHGVYLGGIFKAISLGMPAGLSAMVIGLQPLTMALFAGLMLGRAGIQTPVVRFGYGFGWALPCAWRAVCFRRKYPF